MTAASLRSQTAKDLAQLAREKGVAGWHSMKKEQLIQALVDVTRRRSPKGGLSAPGSREDSQRRHITELQQKLTALKNLAHATQLTANPEPQEDRLVVMVRDPYWLHASWELTQRGVHRAQAALGQRWHSVKPTLRVFRVLESGTAEVERDIAIHGGVSNWYVDVSTPPAGFRMEIGYLTGDGFFYALARSNTVQTPPAGGSAAVDDNWADVAKHADLIYAMSGGYSPEGTSRELQEMLEQKLHRPLGSPMHTRFGNGAIDRTDESLELAVDAEVIVYGATSRQAHITVKGTPVVLRPDGTFSAKLKLAEMRQVIPIVASSTDGVSQRTVILAIERNTKVLGPLHREAGPVR